MRLALIANPCSGAAPDPERLAALLAADGAAVEPTAVEELAGGAPPDRIVVAGGDGSIGPAALAAALLGRPLAVIPTGTANDFARAKRLPLELEAACALARAQRPRTAHAELGLAGAGAARPFVNAASAGLSVTAAHEARPHKRRLGPLAYAVGALKAAVGASPLRCRVRCDGEALFAGHAWQVVVGATGAFGGGSEIGGTSARDERLDVAVVPAGSRAGLVRRAYGMRAGRLTAQRDVAHGRCTVVELELPEHRPRFNVDGELCDCDPPRFTLRPGGFDLVVGDA